MSTITASLDKTFEIDDEVIGRSGEMTVNLTITLGATLATFVTGLYCYVDFLLPDGQRIYKGSYNGAGGTITVVMGVADDILKNDGIVYIQLVVREAAVATSQEIWKSDMVEAYVAKSVNSTLASSAYVVPTLTMPNTYQAAKNPIVDAGDLFDSTNVEDALQELMTDINNIVTGGGTTITGNATEAQVLVSRTFYSNDATNKQTGTMPNNAGDTAEVSHHIAGDDVHVVPQEGYFDGVDDAVIITGYKVLPTEEYNEVATNIFVVGDNGTSSRVCKYRLKDLVFISQSEVIWDINAIVIDETYDTNSFGGVFLASNNVNTFYAFCKQNFSSNSLGIVIYSQSGYCICQNTEYIFVGDTANGNIWRNKKELPYYSPDYVYRNEDVAYGGQVYGIAADDTYTYVGGGTINRVRKYFNDYSEDKATDLVYDSQSDDYGGYIACVIRSESYVYCGGATTRKVWRIDPDDMSKLAESADLGSTINCMTYDATHMYVACTNGNLFKLLLSDLSTVSSVTAYGGAIWAICEYGSYIYIGGATVKKVYKLLKSDLSKVVESPAYPVTITGLAIGDTTTVPA